MTLKAVVGISPFETPDAQLVEALVRAGATGILDLGRDREEGLSSLRRLKSISLADCGIRIPKLEVYTPADFTEFVGLGHLITDASAIVSSAQWLSWQMVAKHTWLQVTSLNEAQRVLEICLPDGLIVKGCESGGRVGCETTFILIQQIRALGIPFWAQGGISLHTAAAAIGAGARGVILDNQFALLQDCAAERTSFGVELKNSDHADTRLIHGQQVFTRPDLRFLHDQPISRSDFESRLGLGPVSERYIPCGQDLRFARKIAERYRTVKNLILSWQRGIRGCLRMASGLPILASGSSMASTLHTRYPIAQGPMTRVSDCPEFAAAVGQNGALPFVALSLMQKPQARALLEKTQIAMQGRPWGVGILGFASEALRTEQFEVLADFTPDAVLIAGGRPEQCAPFEQRGIKTFLHTPSPGLLRQFLKNGIRRFVFEGRECGGHVGPQTSFMLWQTQIDVLLESDVAHEVEVFFAGGIHDAVSAAMVSILAAPLAAQGAKVGILVGTAYLFTHEAIHSGAILPQFQKEALRCTETALLETAPGHATRCAVTPFVDKFERRKEDLRASGIPVKEIWSSLEELNVGRLRIASKGVERIGDQMVKVDAQIQYEEGLFMLGQVAQLRDKPCSMAELHADLTVGAVNFCKNLPNKLRVSEARPVDIAIVGMAAHFPGANNIEEYWQNILAGKNLITEVPKTRWDADKFCDPDARDGKKSISRVGGFLSEVPFDPLEFGIPPQSMPAIEPQQLLSLKTAKAALADAGYLSRPFDRERTSVIFGAEAGTDLSGAYGFRAQFAHFAGPLPDGLDQFLPSLSEDSFPGVLANVIAGRIANRLDLGGANYTVDAACASSLAALDLAIKELIGGDSDMVLCGGVDLHNSLNDYLMFSSVRALSPTGRSRPFSADADGIVIAEGVAVLVLKRLDDARRDGDKIYAVVKGIGASSDGKSLGLTAPRKEGQRRALLRAYDRAGIHPDEIELVEAHGTGTVVGDRTELEALTEVYSESGALSARCALGSVKSQMGHTKCAAGLAGVIKATLALYHGILPPTLNTTTPNPYYRRTKSPFYFTETPLPWLSPRRKAGVSAFGFGGTNFHAVLESHVAEASVPIRSAELFLFASQDDLSLVKRALDSHGQLSFSLLAASVADRFLNAGANAAYAIVAENCRDLLEKITKAMSGASGAQIFAADSLMPLNGKVALVFSGQGSQSLNMGSELFQAFPRLRHHLRRGEAWVAKIFPQGIGQDSEEELKRTRHTQPALGILAAALTELLSNAGVEFAMVAGHSYGELAAIHAAGCLGVDQLLAASAMRGEALESTKPGAMAAVRGERDIIQAAISGLEVHIANHNSPEQCVVSGSRSAIEGAIKLLGQRGISAQNIPVARAFHSPLVEPAKMLFSSKLAGIDFARPQVPVYSNTTGAVHAFGEIKNMLAEQITKPVEFVRMIETMYSDSARHFIEVGPGSILKNLVGQILSKRPHDAWALLPNSKSLVGLFSVLGELAARGMRLDLRVFYDTTSAAYDLDQLANAKPSQTLWLVNGHLARPQQGALPSAGLKPGGFSINLNSMGEPLRQENRDSVVFGYLQAMRELVESQKQVMLQYLRPEPPHDSAPKVVSEVTPVERPKALVTGTPRLDLDIASTVLVTVSQKTGYPRDMLGLEQDIEADLSIDSIKRFEILAELGDKLAVPKDSLEKLSTLKTLGKLIDALKEIDPAHKVSEQEPTKELPGPCVSQYWLRVEQVHRREENHIDLAGKTIALVQDRAGLSEALASKLRSHGVRIIRTNSGDWSDEADIFILADLFQKDGRPLIEVFQTVKKIAAQGCKSLIGITGRGGRFGHGSRGDSHLNRGISGLFKSLAKEHPDKRIKLIDLDPSAEIDDLAGFVLDELRSTDPLVEVGFFQGLRHKLVTVPLLADLPRGNLGLDRTSRILMLGGARGIASTIALKIAAEYGCQFVLTGRTPLPKEEDEATRHCLTMQELREHFIKSKVLNTPAEIDRACRKILESREIRATLARLADLGSNPQYHCLDLRDKSRLGALIDELYSEGNIDGVIHAAGVLSDSLIVDKTPESFARVFETKVHPAEVLEAKLKPEVKFVAFFASVSGCFGNRGQTDYAAANDALNSVAYSLGQSIQGRTVSFNFGPWADRGMVSEELARAYQRQGVGLIPEEDGAQCFLDVLRLNEFASSQVVVMNGSPDAFH